MIKARILSTDSILIKFSDDFIALLLHNPVRRAWDVQLPQWGQRFELHENTPLRMLLRAIQDGKGGGR